MKNPEITVLYTVTDNFKVFIQSLSFIFVCSFIAIDVGSTRCVLSGLTFANPNGSRSFDW